MIQKINNNNWGDVAEIVQHLEKYLTKDEIAKIAPEGIQKWMISILQHPYCYTYTTKQKGLIVTEKLSTCIMRRDPSKPSQIIEVLYYSVPYDREAEVEYKDSLTMSFGDKTTEFTNILGSEKDVSNQQIEEQSKELPEPSELSISGQFREFI